MKKTYRLEDLDCANCAAKLEDAVSKLPGVDSARVNFLSQKMVLEADEAQLESILDGAKKAAKKIDSAIVILE